MEIENAGGIEKFATKELDNMFHEIVNFSQKGKDPREHEKFNLLIEELKKHHREIIGILILSNIRFSSFNIMLIPEITKVLNKKILEDSFEKSAGITILSYIKFSHT